MHNSSNKSKGYMPVPSGPNMTGFDMGKTSSMMDMMQEGGFTRPRTRGAALLARALQKQKDLSLLEDYERAEAERQRKGGLFGSILGTGLGLVGGMIAGPGGVAIGTGLGKSIGESFGAGDAEFVDTRGTVYNQDLFRDVADAGKEFDEGRFNRALSSGLKAGLTAGLTPGGGIYGQYNPLTSSGIENIGKGIMGEGVIGYGGTQGLFSFADPQYMELADDVANVSQSSNLFPSFRQAIGDSLTGGSGLGSLFQFEDGGLIGMQTGGLTAEGILRGQGLVADDTQLGLFQAFDPTAIGRAREETGQNLLDMTLGQGIASGGDGFGAQQSAISKMVEQGQKSLEQQIQDEQKDFESQTLATAGDIVAGGGTFRQFYGGAKTAQTAGGGTTAISGAPANPDDGDTFQALNGKVYKWDENAGSWFEVDQG